MQKGGIVLGFDAAVEDAICYHQQLYCAKMDDFSQEGQCII